MQRECGVPVPKRDRWRMSDTMARACMQHAWTSHLIPTTTAQQTKYEAADNGSISDQH